MRGTFAIMTAIAVPISNQMGIQTSLAVAASLGGGVFGESLILQFLIATVISSMASVSDHIDHAKTQLPYAVQTGSIHSHYLSFNWSI